MTEWVKQKDIGGCGAATTAMILGCSYEEAKDQIDAAPCHTEPIDWNVGVSHIEIDYVLGEHGWYGNQVYIAWQQQLVVIDEKPPYWELKPGAVWPPEPFAPIHYAQVASGNLFHFVVMLADGTVLDPMFPGHFKLSDWPTVANVRGLIKR